MDKVIEKISAYNIFTNLLPGVIYCYLADSLYGIPLIQETLLIGAFVYYFVGMVISRIASVLLEPILTKVRFVRYADYQDFVTASKVDAKLDTLVESNNVYRSTFSMLFCVMMTAAWSQIATSCPLVQEYSRHIVVILLFILFLLSYKKQTRYITERVRNHKEKK